MVGKLLFGLIIFSAFIVNAQDFTFEVDGSDVSGDTISINVNETDFTGNYTGSINLILNNGASSDKMIVFVRHNVEQNDLSSHEICDDQQCMQANPVTADHVLYSPDGKSISAGSTLSWDIHVRFTTTPVGHSFEHYTVYEVGNESNKVELDVNYTVSTTAVNELANKLTVSEPYPNPANASVSFNYNLNSNGYVTIHDVTGKQIGNLELVQGIEKATYNTSDLNNGIYFYNVYVDGVKTKTDKFIVRH